MLCTADATYDLKHVETTNALLLVTPQQARSPRNRVVPCFAPSRLHELRTCERGRASDAGIVRSAHRGSMRMREYQGCSANIHIVVVSQTINGVHRMRAPRSWSRRVRITSSNAHASVRGCRPSTRCCRCVMTSLPCYGMTRTTSLLHAC